MFRCLLLIFSLTFVLGLTGQVGVNNPNPSQALDVGGKIQISDDAATPEEGTIRWNNSNDDFEGYDGDDWKSLTESSDVSPTARPAAIYHFGLDNNSTWAFFEQGASWPAADVPTDDGEPLSPNQFFVVEKVTFTPTTKNTDSTDSYYYGIARSIVSGANFNPQLYYRSNAGNGTLEITGGGKAPLLVVNPGRTLRVWNSSTSPGDVRVVVFGVFVDDVNDYFGL
ncbi:hypothetical protein CEQ90_14575 [Lewinellaceae bacterium SD302]|nr:hypothetical protein CEQ90_14575 [Lewinellaceae bacterium SD302]